VVLTTIYAHDGGNRAGLVSLNVGCTDDLGGLGHFRLDVRGELLGRGGDDNETSVLEFFLDVLRVEDAGDFGIELRQDVLWQVGGRDKAVVRVFKDSASDETLPLLAIGKDFSTSLPKSHRFPFTCAWRCRRGAPGGVPTLQG
jgi:hypothetical protein